jgi:hypothetical protein
MIKIDAGILEQANKNYLATMSDENRGVRDPIITPYAMAMKLAGYIEMPDRHCSKLRGCPICPVGKSNYSTRYKSNNGTIV